METRKIVLACFFGGVVCCTIAILFSSTYWWLGLLAGFAGGYISYEFCILYKAIKAIRIAFKEIVIMRKIIGYSVLEIMTLLSKPHPVLHPSMLLAVVVYICITPTALYFDNIPLLFILVALQFLIILLLIIPGSYLGDHSYYYFPDSLEAKEKEHFSLMKEDPFYPRDNYVLKPLTYANCLRWCLLGLYVIFCKYLIIAISLIIILFKKLIWELFKIVHSQKRIFCAVYGTIGGGLTYFLFTPTNGVLIEQLMIVICGGLVGAGFGVLSKEIVSKQILHLDIIKKQ